MISVLFFSEGKVTENLKQRILRKREQWQKKRASSRNLKFTLRKDSKEKDSSSDILSAAKDNNTDPSGEL